MDTKEGLKDNGKEDIKDSYVSLDVVPKKLKLNKAILLKTERLASAVHLVTGLMDTKEAIRGELRSVSLSAISDLYFLNQNSTDRGLVSDKILKKVAHITSLLEVCFTGGLISEMNHSILRDEYFKLKEVLTNFQLTEGVESFLLPSQFFGPELTAIENLDEKKLSLKDTVSMSLMNNKKDRKLATKQVDVLEDKKDKSTNPRKSNKDARQELILKVIKDGVEYTIKDIISDVSIIDPQVDCSNKTIQRDLLELVSNGALAKTGERRWSRYSRKL
jgi:hypothetical protein